MKIIFPFSKEVNQLSPPKLRNLKEITYISRGWYRGQKSLIARINGSL